MKDDAKIAWWDMALAILAIPFVIVGIIVMGLFGGRDDTYHIE